MINNLSFGELVDGCRAYLKLSESERGASSLFCYWDHLFFKLAVNENESEMVWSAILKILEVDLNGDATSLIATGPFEEMLAAMTFPNEKLFTSEAEKSLVRDLSKYVWFGRVSPDVAQWIREM